MCLCVFVSMFISFSKNERNSMYECCVFRSYKIAIINFTLSVYRSYKNAIREFTLSIKSRIRDEPVSHCLKRCTWCTLASLIFWQFSNVYGYCRGVQHCLKRCALKRNSIHCIELKLLLIYIIITYIKHETRCTWHTVASLILKTLSNDCCYCHGAQHCLKRCALESKSVHCVVLKLFFVYIVISHTMYDYEARYMKWNMVQRCRLLIGELNTLRGCESILRKNISL